LFFLPRDLTRRRRGERKNRKPKMSFGNVQRAFAKRFAAKGHAASINGNDTLLNFVFVVLVQSIQFSCRLHDLDAV